MKKTLKAMAVLLFAVIMVSMSSCSKQDTYQSRIVGKWERIHSYGVGPDGNFDITYEENGGIWVFNSDGGFSSSNNDGSDAVHGIYSITDNILMINYGLSMPFEIQELSNTTMILHQSFIGESTQEFRKK